ncbi:MAG: hypothetical protein MMC33_007895 [Icmadophila ericetorum]|nr:hypothetical protein [Icmadophila ericetorum]
MAPSGRGRQSTAPRRQTHGPTPLPIYQPPACALNDAGQRSLMALSQDREMNRLKQHIKKGHETLQENVTEINERLQVRVAHQDRVDAKRVENGREEDEDGKAMIEDMKQKVEELTRNIEAGVRSLIDAQATIEGVEKALGEIQHNVAAGGGVAAPTQTTLGASQFRLQTRNRPVNSDDEEEEGTQVAIVGPVNMLKRKLAEHEAHYGQLPLRNRYATHNDYVSFKKIVHDAQHPGEDAPPLPNASTWFPDPHFQSSGGRAKGGDEDGSGSDIEIASERISDKCPLTLLRMEDPVTSKKCPHSFEKRAILEMISLSTTRVGGGGRGEKMIKCPVCEADLTAADVEPNPILLRKIKRIQAAEAAALEADEDSDSDDAPVRGTQHRRPQAEDLDSDSGDNIEDYEAGGKKRRSNAAGMGKAKAEQVKRERPGTASRIPDSQAVRNAPRSSGQVVDLEDSGEE